MTRRRKTLSGVLLKSCPTRPVSLRRVRLDRGGYDSSGRYWGANIGGRIGDLYEVDYETADESRTDHIRANSRAQAKAKLKADCPGIRFKR